MAGLAPLACSLVTGERYTPATNEERSLLPVAVAVANPRTSSVPQAVDTCNRWRRCRIPLTRLASFLNQRNLLLCT